MIQQLNKKELKKKIWETKSYLKNLKNYQNLGYLVIIISAFIAYSNIGPKEPRSGPPTWNSRRAPFETSETYEKNRKRYEIELKEYNNSRLKWESWNKENHLPPLAVISIGCLLSVIVMLILNGIYKSNHKRASKELEDFEKLLEKEVQKRQNEESRKREKVWNEKKQKNNEKLKILDKLIIKEFDKDGNGIIDVIEDDNVFIKLVEKNQELLLEREKEFNQRFIHPFIKLGDYLIEKRKNLQFLFDSKGRIDRSEQLENFRGILKDEVHLYELLLINSLNMVASLVDNNQIVFYSLYEKFDKLAVFTTNHEKEVSSLLKDTNKLLSSVISEIRNLNITMVNAIEDLSYMTEQSQLSMENKLTDIGSTLKVGNMINSITAYQSYKTNKNTKKLK